MILHLDSIPSSAVATVSRSLFARVAELGERAVVAARCIPKARLRAKRFSINNTASGSVTSPKRRKFDSHTRTDFAFSADVGAMSNRMGREDSPHIPCGKGRRVAFSRFAATAQDGNAKVHGPDGLLVYAKIGASKIVEIAAEDTAAYVASELLLRLERETTQPQISAVEKHTVAGQTAALVTRMVVSNTVQLIKQVQWLHQI